VVQGVSQFCY